MKRSQPGRVPERILATFLCTAAEARALLGEPHDLVSDADQVPAPSEYWFLDLDDVGSVVVELVPSKGFANLHAMPPMPRRALRALGIAPERVEWVDPTLAD